MIIHDRGTTIVVTVHDRQGVEIIEQRNDSQAFLGWWKDRAKTHKAPRFQPTGTDRRHAVQLVNRYGLDRLKQLGVMFWRRYSEPLVSGEYGNHMILFRSKLAEVERDVDEEETTETL